MLTRLLSGQTWFGSLNGQETFLFSICPFSLSHNASYPVRNGFVFIKENGCQTLNLTAHLHIMLSSRMRGGIPLHIICPNGTLLNVAAANLACTSQIPYFFD